MSENEPDHRQSPESEPDHEHPPRGTPQIYVTAGLPLRADLVAGTWLDMARSTDAIYDELRTVTDQEIGINTDRLYIWDYRGFGAFEVTTGPLGLEGTHSLELLARVARGITEHGPAFAAWAQVHEDEPELFDRFPRIFKGHYATLGEFIRDQLEPQGYEAALDAALPDSIRPFATIDYDAIADQAFSSGDLIAYRTGDGYWIFDESA
ncbi:antirestriction protein ArdA [Nocardia farcinica]|uniref:antirestriction protein ArdA n=1 Tax=Nocardia farcinica TaxID=37329 RepID=UPI0024556620|nr:antirestriction protein ArdA [Nocardia farcinica]